MPWVGAGTIAAMRIVPRLLGPAVGSRLGQVTMSRVQCGTYRAAYDPLPVPGRSAMLTKRQLVRLRAATVTPGSNRLGLALQLMGVSQGTVAKELGVPQPYVSDVVRSRYRTITVANARRFARYCGCLIEDLFPMDAA